MVGRQSLSPGLSAVLDNFRGMSSIAFVEVTSVCDAVDVLLDKIDAFDSDVLSNSGHRGHPAPARAKRRSRRARRKVTLA
jgi:hypothetical protein